jgi:hypothetical protein
MVEAIQDQRQRSFRRKFVTIRAAHSGEEMDLELPGNRPVAELMPDLLKALGWPAPDEGGAMAFQLRTESGQALQEEETLDSVGIENADVLWIGLSESPASLAPVAAPAGEGGSRQEPVVPGLAAVPATHGPGHERRSGIAPPVPSSLRVEVASLVTKRGFVFELGAPPVLIGRKSRGVDPDIDLTEVDPGMASSRRHARVLLRGQTYLLEALPTTNGTYLNGLELKAGEARPLQSGDRVLLGSDGVELAFFLGGESIPPSYFRAG